ncbi:MAG: hypothetical protein WDN28_12845 [Chthoniobacter sp.]
MEDFLLPGLIWNHNWLSKLLPYSVVSDIGVLTGSVPGNPPELTGNRSWFCIRIRASQRGNIWQIQQSWQLTGPHGVAPELYQRA